MTDTRLIPISAEDVERLRDIIALTIFSLDAKEGQFLRSLVTRYESGITEQEGALVIEWADEWGAGGLEGKLRSAFTQEQDR